MSLALAPVGALALAGLPEAFISDEVDALAWVAIEASAHTPMAAHGRTRIVRSAGETNDASLGMAIA